MVEGPWEGAALAFFLTGADGVPGEDPDVVAPAVDGAAAVELPTPTGDQLFLLDEANYPDLLGAYAIPALFGDEDGDGVHDDGEAWVGVGTTMVYLQEAPRDLARLGFADGWNSYTVDEAGMPQVHDLDAIPIAADLWPVVDPEPVTLAGTYSGESPDASLAVVSLWALSGGRQEPVFDDPGAFADLTWALTLTEAPPDDHLVYNPDVLQEIGMEIPLAYQDDGDGAYEVSADPILAGACADGQLVALLYFERFSSLQLAQYAVYLGWHLGWVPVADFGEDTMRVAEEEELLELEIDEACVFPG